MYYCIYVQQSISSTFSYIVQHYDHAKTSHVRDRIYIYIDFFLSNVKHIQQKKYHAFFCRNYMFTAFDPRKNNFFLPTEILTAQLKLGFNASGATRNA